MKDLTPGSPPRPDGERSDREITRSAGWVVRLDANADELWRREFDAGDDGCA